MSKGCLTVLAGLLFSIAVFAADDADTLRLLGASLSDVKARLGEPREALHENPGITTYRFHDDLSVFVHDDTAYLYVAGEKSSFATAGGVRIGSTLDQITAEFGTLGLSEDTETYENTAKPAVLYHITSIDRYKVSYPDRKVSFILDRSQKVIAVFVTEHMASE